MLLLGVDVGGTFTDAVLVDGGRTVSAKAPTTPGEQAAGVMKAVESVLEQAGASPGDVDRFAHGMTVGTNALLEERGARTALIATEGFADLLDIGRQERPSLYRLCDGRPRALVPPELRYEAPERTGPEGIVRPLDERAIEHLVGRVAAAGPESVAVALLFSYLDPAHEQAIARALKDAMPDLHVSASSTVLPRIREYERTSTTVIDAYLSPLLGRYLRRLADTATERGLPQPLVMRSSGGVAPVAEAASSGAWSVLSGPAGGAVGASLIAGLSGGGNAIGFDMGGTSCDVCVVEDGGVRRTDALEVGGRVLQLPAIDVHTVGAGGGSVGWMDDGGALRVGPRSAGADPGPAAYGKGGLEPTVTDANVALARLPPGGTLAGGVELDAEAADAAVQRLGRRLGLSTVEAAEGIVRIANLEMVRAIRVMTVERGIDPRRFALLSFGGAGGLHAAALADELDVGRVLCPRSGGVLSALGLIASEVRRDVARTVLLRGDELTREQVEAATGELAATASRGLPDPDLEVAHALRYEGQAFELEVDGGNGPDPDRLVEAFAAAHEARYGYRDPGSPVELVDIRVAARVPGARPEPRAAQAGDLVLSERDVRVDGSWKTATVARGDPPEGFRARGPAVLELPETTVLIPGGWTASVDAYGTTVMDRETR